MLCSPDPSKASPEKPFQCLDALGQRSPTFQISQTISGTGTNSWRATAALGQLNQNRWERTQASGFFFKYIF